MLFIIHAVSVTLFTTKILQHTKGEEKKAQIALRKQERMALLDSDEEDEDEEEEEEEEEGDVSLQMILHFHFLIYVFNLSFSQYNQSILPTSSCRLISRCMRFVSISSA